MGGNFCENLEKAPRIKFEVLNFVAQCYIMNVDDLCELGTCGANFGYFSVVSCVRGYQVYNRV